MAGGFGKRLKPLTNDTLSQYLNWHTIVEVTINYLKSLGINKILISTFHMKKIVNYFGDGLPLMLK